MAYRGRYIVLEGGEGVGKSTQAEILAKKLGQRGLKVAQVFEPGSDPLAQEIRGLVLSPRFNPVSRTEVLLFNAARAQSLVEVDRKLSAGIWVISDRSYISTVVMQGYARGLDVLEVEQVCRFAVGDVEPDLIMILAGSERITDSRRSERGTTDRIEQESIEFHRRANAGYRDIAQRMNLPIIDADGSKEEVGDRIWHQIERLLGEHPS